DRPYDVLSTFLRIGPFRRSSVELCSVTSISTRGGMTAKWGLVLVSTLTIGLLAAEAQQLPGKQYRIGFLYEALRVVDVLRAPKSPFYKALSELGYTEGQNLIVEVRSAEGRLERIPEIVAEFLRLRVDVIVVSTSPVAHRVKQATSTVPIVITSGSTLPE